MLKSVLSHWLPIWKSKVGCTRSKWLSFTIPKNLGSVPPKNTCFGGTFLYDKDSW